jgi:sec-independent protein translocase protein TatB
MFGLSFGEILIILVVALLILGPERLPKVARTVGKGLRDLRRTTGSIREIIEDEIYLDEVAERRPAAKDRPVEGEPVPRAPVHVAPQASEGQAGAERAASAPSGRGEP